MEPAEEPDDSLLLAACVCNDLTPDERARVERALAADKHTRALLQDLKSLHVLLQQGRIAVSPELLLQLRQRTAQAHAAAPESAAVPESAAAPEGAAAPEASLSPEAVQTLTHLLDQHKLTVRPELTEQLSQRLRNRARAPHTRKTSASTSALFVCTAQPQPWQRAKTWALSAAALVLVSLGGAWLAGVFRAAPPPRPLAQTEPLPQDTQPRHEVLPVPIVEAARAEALTPVRPSPESEHALPAEVPPPASPDPIVAERESVKHSPNYSPAGMRQTIAETPSRQTPVHPETDSVPPRVADQRPVTPGILPPQKSHTGGLAAGVPNTAAPAPAPHTTRPTTENSSDEPAGTGTGNGTGSGSTGIAANGSGGTNANAGSGTSKVPAQTNPLATPASGAVVAATRGTVQASTVSGVKILEIGKELASGSEISTDQGKVLLLLPGDGHLALNSNSNLSFEIRDKITYVTLNSGEIFWMSGSGTLSLNASGIVVTNAKHVNAKLEGSKLTVSVLSKTAQAGPKGKTTVVRSGDQAIVSLGGDGSIEKKSYSGQPDAWAKDLTPPPESSAKGTGKTAQRARRR